MTDLEQKLAAARVRLNAAVRALAPKHLGGEVAEFSAARQAVLAAERELAASRDEEHAVPLGLPVQWDAGAPMPQLLVNDQRTLLLFLVRTADAHWDGTYVNIKDPASAARERLALVTLRGCAAAKLGIPNDEVLHGHPLYGKGLEPNSAQRVMGSRWLAELEAINGVDPQQQRQHIVFWFHDTTFECIAEGFDVELHTCSMQELLAIACRRLVD